MSPEASARLESEMGGPKREGLCAQGGGVPGRRAPGWQCCVPVGLAVRIALTCREEKEFGFQGTEGRLLLLQDCGVRVHVPEDEGGLVSGKAGLGGLLGLTLGDRS